MSLSEKIRPSFTVSDTYREWMRDLDRKATNPENQASRIIDDFTTDLLIKFIFSY